MNYCIASSVPLAPSGGFFVLPGGPVTAKKSERAPYSHSFGAACYTAPVIKDLFSSEGTRTLTVTCITYVADCGFNKIQEESIETKHLFN